MRKISETDVGLCLCKNGLKALKGMEYGKL